VVRLELDQQVDVARRAEVVAQHGAEQRETANVVLLAEGTHVDVGQWEAFAGRHGQIIAPSRCRVAVTRVSSGTAELDRCPKYVYKYRTMATLTELIRTRIETGDPTTVWTPVDFLDLGARHAVDKTLQRLARSATLRRIDRGLYGRPRTSGLTRQAASPDYRKVLDAIARRDQVRMLIDGLTAANDLGLTTAVPARVVVHTDARRRSIPLGRLTIQFKLTAPSKLYWAGRPAMRVVQALHWLKDTLSTDREDIVARIAAVAADPVRGPAIQDDLRSGLPALPAWMQDVVRDILQRAGGAGRGPEPHSTVASDVVVPTGGSREQSQPGSSPRPARSQALRDVRTERDPHRKNRSGRRHRRSGE
jgi:hypothetical protein